MAIQPVEPRKDFTKTQGRQKFVLQVGKQILGEVVIVYFHQEETIQVKREKQ